jgi:hypothetical protein
MSTISVDNLQGLTSNIITMASGQVLYTPGSIIQVQQTVKTDTFSAAPNGTWIDITGMSVNITPKKTSSKIFILVTLVGAGNSTTPKARVLRDSTVIAVGDTSGSKQSAMLGSFLMKDTNQADTYTHQFLDSPATISQINYKMQINSDNTQTWYLNRSNSDQDNTTGGRYISVITVMEVAA